MVLVFAILVILGACFALIYLAIHLYTHSEVKRQELEQRRYDTAMEVASGEFYSIRLQLIDEGEDGYFYLTLNDPRTYCAKPATMGSPARIQIEAKAEVMDVIALAWIRHRRDAGAIGRPV